MQTPRMISAALFASACVLAACGPSPNPDQVWLAPDGSERYVRLSPVEPNPF